MKANELRIGNWINYPRYWGDKPIRVTGISVVDRRDDHTGIYEEFLYLLGNDFLTDENFDSFVEYKQGVISPEEAKPIPLTEEWLLKFGFIVRENIAYNIFFKSFTRCDTKGCEQKIEISINENCTNLFLNNYFICKIEFVHQLQNLIFALTGKEL